MYIYGKLINKSDGKKNKQSKIEKSEQLTISTPRYVISIYFFFNTYRDFNFEEKNNIDQHFLSLSQF